MDWDLFRGYRNKPTTRIITRDCDFDDEELSDEQLIDKVKNNPNLMEKFFPNFNTQTSSKKVSIIYACMSGELALTSVRSLKFWKNTQYSLKISTKDNKDVVVIDDSVRLFGLDYMDIYKLCEEAGLTHGFQ